MYGTFIGSHGCHIEWYNFRWPWVTHNPGFEVTRYLKVEYLTDGAWVFNYTKHSCRSLFTRGSTENVQKLGVVAEFFLLKALKGDLHQWWKLSLTELVFVETSTQSTYSLSGEGFGYNHGRLKSSASHASRENTLPRCGKIKKCRRYLILQRRFVDGRTEVITGSAAKRQTAGIKFTHRPKVRFFAPQGRLLDRFMSNLAGQMGTWIRMAMHNFTSIATVGCECGPKVSKMSTFW